MSIGVVVFDGAEELDFVGPWEVFTGSALVAEQAGREPDQVRLVAESSEPVRCGKGLRVLPDATFAEHPAFDVVLVPGGVGVPRVIEDPALLGWLAAVAAEARWTTSVCTGAFVLHAAGLAEGRRLATHWIAEDHLAELGVDVARDVRWVRDGPLVTSQGVSAGIDMVLWLVGQLHGVEHARATRRYLQYDPAPPYAADV